MAALNWYPVNQQDWINWQPVNQEIDWPDWPEDGSPEISEARKSDIRAIAQEAIAAGFNVELDSIAYYGGEYDNSFAVKFTNSTNKQFTLSSIWRTDWSGPRWCRRDTFKIDANYLSSKDIAEIELGDEQLFFLNWSSEWEMHIWPYWEGRTEFKTIEEFIQNLKESAQTAEPLYTSAMIKAARAQQN